MDYALKLRETLKENRIFSGCNDAEIEALIASSRIGDYMKEDIVFSPNNHERCIGLLIAGSCLVEKGEGKNHVVISKLNEGEMFGAVTLFSTREHGFSNTIRALNACKVIFIGRSFVVSLMKDNMSVWRNYISYLSDRVYFLNDRIAELTASNTQGRIAIYLYEMSKVNKKISLDISITSLSKVLDIGRSSLYRGLDELEQSRAIERRGKEIMVLDREILKSYAK